MKSSIMKRIKEQNVNLIFIRNEPKLGGDSSPISTFFSATLSAPAAVSFILG